MNRPPRRYRSGETMAMALILFLFVVVPLAMSVWIGLRAGIDDPVIRILLALLPLLASTALFNLTFIVCSSPHFDWNGAKLAPILAMLKGYPLYGDKDTGVMTAWIYGPAAALVFLPSAVFSRPTSIIMAGVVINMVCTITPAAWLHWQAGRRGGRLVALAVFLLFVYCAGSHESIRRAVYLVGPDGPALGLLASSCALLMGKRSTIALALSAIGAVLACWCKQSILPFLIVAPMYLLIVGGRRITGVYCAVLALSGLVISAILSVSFDPTNMWFHMVTISASHGFSEAQNGNLLATWHGIGEFLADLAASIAMLLALAMIGALAGLFPNAMARRRDALRQFVIETPSCMLLATAIVLAPSSVLGFVKVGGYYNNFALTHYFLLLSITVALLWWWPALIVQTPRIAKLIIAGVCVFCCAAAMNILTQPELLAGWYTTITHPFTNHQETIYAYSKAHPGTAFFPWNNLSTLLSEGKLYHFEWGLVDRYEAKLPPSTHQINAHLPKNIKFVAFPPIVQTQKTMRYLFNRPMAKVNLEELPGFTVYTDPPAGLRQAAPSSDSPGGFPPPAKDPFRL